MRLASVGWLHRSWLMFGAGPMIVLLIAALVSDQRPAIAADPPAQTWQAIIRPADRALIESTDGLIRRLLGSIEADAEYVTTGRDSFDTRDLRAVLQPAKRADAADLVGRWRCRSIQPTRDAVYVYGYFRCDISATGGALSFRKATGSQTRHGALYPDDGTRFVFLGRGNSLKKGLLSSYGDPPVEGEYFDLDSVGVFFSRGIGKVTAIFPSAEYGYEIYDLRRD